MRQRLGVAGRAVARYFTATDGPYNLAIARIVLFGLMAVLALSSQPRQFASLPLSVLDPPPWSVELPVRPGLAAAAQLALVVASLLAVVGLWTRGSTLVATAAATYYFGLPQMFSKVSHDRHHLVWFAAILAVSRCADALSADSLRRARRRSTEVVAGPREAVAYALPLRLMWLLLGLVYLFPGLWKLGAQGLHWASPENMRSLLEYRWAQLGGWTPPFAVDRHPWLLWAAGIGTLVFELSAIVLVTFAWGRRVLVAAGLLFHNLTALLMRIPFLPLQVSYAVLVNWAGLGRWMGRRRHGAPVALDYVAGCGPCCEVVAAVRALDVLGQVVEQPRSGATPQQPHRAHVLLPGAACDQDELVRRVPLLRAWSRKPAAALGSHVGGGASPAPRHDALAVGAAVVVASCIGLGVATAGIRGVEAAWPISVHPTYVDFPPARTVRIVVQDERGERVVLRRAFPRIDVARFAAIERHIITSPAPERAQQLRDLWREGGAALLPSARSVTFLAQDMRPRAGGGLAVVGSKEILTIRR